MTTSQPPTVLITGASGFIGRHVVRRAAQQRLPVRLMVHRRPVHSAASVGRFVTADLSDPASLHGVCDGVDVLVHCASHIGVPSELCETVNARGSAALVAEAQRAGVRRIVYLSTASVYGRGPFKRMRAGELTRAPASATSRSRAWAEDAVLAAGGIVLRPHLVYGEADTWVVPRLAQMLRTLPGTVDRWRTRMSVIAVEDLARALLAVGLAPGTSLSASVYHANHPEPVECDELLRAIAAAAGIPYPVTDLTHAQASAFWAARVGSSHDLDMMTTDHWFDSTELWSDLGCDPGPGFRDRFLQYAPWYRQKLHAG
ncbi:NAD-dependent epimerase/dehydratase family protein [Streptomyces sp. NPDC001678]|uniref:NAD-dependent epimerase/dehydratase family protein n=1 Tax=Streptomyces sp. NPDC001678 TaxID=3364599 RepID=UPI00367CD4D3